MDTAIPFTPDAQSAIPFTPDPPKAIPFTPDAAPPAKPGLLTRLGVTTGEPVDWQGLRQIGSQLANLKPDIFPQPSATTEKAYPRTAGAYEGATKSLEGFLTPPNIALAAGTAGLGDAIPAIAPIIEKVLAPLFASAAVKQAAQTAGTEAGTPASQTTPLERSRNLTGAGLDTLAAGLLGAKTASDFMPAQPKVADFIGKPQPKEENANARTSQETPVPKGPQAGVQADAGPGAIPFTPDVQPQGGAKEVTAATAVAPPEAQAGGLQPQTPDAGELLRAAKKGTPEQRQAVKDIRAIKRSEGYPSHEAVIQAVHAGVETDPDIVATVGKLQNVTRPYEPVTTPDLTPAPATPTKEQDAAEYKKVQAEMEALRKAPASEMMTDAFGERMMAVGKRMEDIKNRNGGYAPGTEPPGASSSGESTGKVPVVANAGGGATAEQPRSTGLDEIGIEELAKAGKPIPAQTVEDNNIQDQLSEFYGYVKNGDIYVPSQKPAPEPARKGKAPKQQFESLDDIDASKLSPAQKIKARDAFLKAKGVAPPADEAAPTVTDKPLPWGPGATNIEELRQRRAESAGNPDVHGPSQRVLDERAKAGQIEPVYPGEGSTPEAQIAQGRQLYAKAGPEGAESALKEFERTKNINSETMSLFRARGEALASIARKTEEHFGTNSPEYEKAYKDLSDWETRVKKGATEAHKVFVGLQGETDLDTGDFTSIRRRFQELNEGKDFTPRQKEAAERIQKENKNAARKDDQAQEAVRRKIKSLAPAKDVTSEDAKKLFEGHTGGKLNNDQLKALWSRVSYHMDQGTPKDRAVSAVATELGMKWADVVRGLAQNKEVAHLSDEAWKTQLNRRQLKARAQQWLLETTEPKIKTVFEHVPNFLFQAKTGWGAHGLVALGTHAPSEIYPALLRQAVHPMTLDRYFRAYGTMWKMFKSPAFFEQQMQALKADPLWAIANKGGVQNDPYTVEDFTSPETAKWAQKFTGAGNRGYAVLKVLRQDNFNEMWKAIPEELRSTEVDRLAMAKALGPDVNHATGTTETRAPNVLHYALFAPRLAGSRIASLLVDPLKAAVTGGQSLTHVVFGWKDATPAEKVFARNQLKQKATIAAVYYGLLNLNQAVLSASGSKQQINLYDPMKSDWLKFKIAGQNVGYGSQFITLIRLPLRIEATVNPQSRFARWTYPDEKAGGELLDFERTQESPFAGVGMDLALRQDTQERQLPNSNFPNPKRLRAQDIDKYTWPEWITQQGLAIPMQEPMEEVWRQGFGLDDQHIERMGSALLKASVMGVTGARISQDYNVKP